METADGDAEGDAEAAVGVPETVAVGALRGLLAALHHSFRSLYAHRHVRCCCRGEHGLDRCEVALDLLQVPLADPEARPEPDDGEEQD